MSAPAIGLRAGFAPGPNAVIDWSHPLTQGLQFYFLAAARRDLVRGLAPDVWSVDLVSTPYGIGARSAVLGAAAVEWPIAATTHLNFTGTQPFSVMSIAATSSLASYSQLLSRTAYVSESNNQGWLLQLRSSSDGRPGLTLGCSNNNGSAVYSADNSGTSVYAANRFFVFAGATGSSRRNYVTALQTGTPATPTVASASAKVAIRQDTAGTLTVVSSAVWNRELLPAELAALQADPFQIFRQ